MVTRSVQFVANEHYHVYNRGNSKQKIFLNHSDYQRFLDLLHLANTTERINLRNTLRESETVFSTNFKDKLVSIHAVCLMPNHYHLIITPLTDTGMSKFMLKLGTGYSMYFNTKYERTGSLFEGRFRAKHVSTDEHLKYLFSYIHLNPIDRADRDAYPKAVSYPYSSLAYYLKDDHSPSSPRAALGIAEIISTDLFRRYLPKRENIKQELEDWLNLAMLDV